MMHLVLARGLSGRDMGQYQFEMGHCAGRHCSVQPENSVLRVQGSPNLTFAHTGKFGQILCYTCDVVRMVHEQHDAACSGQRVEVVVIWAIPI